MIQQRRLRFLLERSQVLLLVGLVVALFVAGSFINLAITKSAALSRQDVVAGKLEQALDQRDRLQEALWQAQQGQGIEGKAYDYYGQTEPGVIVVMPASEATSADTAVQPERSTSAPYWGEWWKRLGQP